MPAVSRRTKKIAVAVIITATLFVGICLYGYFDPEQSRWFPKCLFLTLTGWKCPGCGTARALHAALHGRFADALRFNAALPAALALLALCVARPRLARRPAFAWTVLALVLAWGVARNLLGM